MNKKERIKKYGEVFTPVKIVKKMCDLIPQDIWEDTNKTFFEPTCGDGAFLIEIIERKIKNKLIEPLLLVAISSIYGVDIMADNVEESKKNMWKIIRQYYEVNELLEKNINTILNKNIQVGDTLNGSDKIFFYKWDFYEGYFRIVKWKMSSMLEQDTLFGNQPEKVFEPIFWTDLHLIDNW